MQTLDRSVRFLLHLRSKKTSPLIVFFNMLTDETSEMMQRPFGSTENINKKMTLGRLFEGGLSGATGREIKEME